MHCHKQLKASSETRMEHWVGVVFVLISFHGVVPFHPRVMSGQSEPPVVEVDNLRLMLEETLGMGLTEPLVPYDTPVPRSVTTYMQALSETYTQMSTLPPANSTLIFLGLLPTSSKWNSLP